ncbi:hypothetical protein KO361_03340 [Candidatus Woesearchaeota archaeon]|nr:hypothetical protein [Candidatus Woesearchaeota archaeon]
MDLNKDIICSLREDARLSLSSFSRNKGVSVKKAHYEFGKVKKDVTKFVSVIDFESLGFKRLIIFFLDAVQGLVVSSRFKPFLVNNSVRLDKGLFVEYLFLSVDEQKLFLKDLKRKKISFEYYLVDSVIKQEGFIH